MASGVSCTLSSRVSEGKLAYKLVVASLHSGQIVASVSCAVRRFRPFLEPPSSVVVVNHPLLRGPPLIDVSSSFAVYPSPVTAFSSAPSPLVDLWIMLLPFLLFDGSWIWIGIAQERDPEEGHNVTNLGCSPSWI